MRALLLCLATLALITALTLFQALRNEAQAEIDHPPLGQLIAVDGQQVHAYVAGAGPDLVLIHGASGNLRDFTFDLVDRLSTRYRVIAFDRPGLGYSDPIGDAGATISQQARLLAQAARQLDAERPMVLGHSLGGAVALAWALEAPDNISGLIIVSGVSHPWDTGLGAYYSVISSGIGQHLVVPLLTAWAPDSVIENRLASAFAPDPPPEGYGAHFGPRLTLRRASMRANALQRAGLLAGVEAQAGRYGEINLPLEIVHTEDDPVVSFTLHAEALARDVTGARLVALPGATHMPHHVFAEEVVAAIDRAAARVALRAE